MTAAVLGLALLLARGQAVLAAGPWAGVAGGLGPNVRAAPTTASAILGSMPAGAPVRIVACQQFETAAESQLVEVIGDGVRLDVRTGALRFDVDRLARRLIGATDWLTGQPGTRALSVGYFGASTGPALALIAAAERPEVVEAVVSRGGGPPDLASAALSRVRAPTLLIVGEVDVAVLALDRAALARVRATRELTLVPVATHVFEEPGALDEAAGLARTWFGRYLTGRKGDDDDA